MSLDLALRQLHRLTALHSSASVLPGGRLINQSEGKALAKKAMLNAADAENAAEYDENDAFVIPADEGTANAAARAAHNSRSTVLVENEVSRRIVTMRQKQLKKANAHKVVQQIKKDRLPEKLLKEQLPKVRHVAEKTYNKPKVDAKAAKDARRERLGVEKKKKKQ